MGVGLLLFDLWLISAVGALSSFLVPSGFLGSVLSGEEDEGVIEDTGGRVLRRIGTKALRTSSGDDSLPLSLGLLGGVLEGLFGTIIVAFGGSGGYSYFMWSAKGYEGITVGGKLGAKRSV